MMARKPKKVDRKYCYLTPTSSYTEVRRENILSRNRAVGSRSTCIGTLWVNFWLYRLSKPTEINHNQTWPNMAKAPRVWWARLSSKAKKFSKVITPLLEGQRLSEGHAHD